MDALTRIEKAGFDVTPADDGFDITPASALTTQQREFLKLHKAEIINELQTRHSDIELQLLSQLRTPALSTVPPQKTETKTKNKTAALSAALPALIKCHDCLHFKCFNQHGGGAGSCNIGVQANGSCWWSDSQHECEKFDAAVEWVYYEEPQGGKTVMCLTPNGKLIEVEATIPEHAAFLRRMNPAPTKEKS